jgi:hypothetical protein
MKRGDWASSNYSFETVGTCKSLRVFFGKEALVSCNCSFTLQETYFFKPVSSQCVSHVSSCFLSLVQTYVTTSNGDIGLSQYQWQADGASSQPRYVHAFTYTKRCCHGNGTATTDTDSDTVGLELRASEIGFPPAVQRLADVANTLLLHVLAVQYAGDMGLYS